jgi:hypothetical protein
MANDTQHTTHNTQHTTHNIQQMVNYLNRLVYYMIDCLFYLKMSYNRYDNYDFINPLSSVVPNRPMPLIWYRCNMEPNIIECKRIKILENTHTHFIDNFGFPSNTEKDVSVCLHVPCIFHKPILENKLGRSVEIIYSKD